MRAAGKAGRRVAVDRLAALFGIQGKMTAVFLLLTLLAMQVIGAGLLYHLRQYYLGMSRQQLSNAALMISDQAASVLDGGSDLPRLRSTIEGALQPPANGALLLNAAGTVVYSTSGLPPSLAAAPRPESEVAAAEAGRETTLLVRAASGETQIWAAAPIRSAGRIAGVILVEGSATQIYDIITHVRSILLTWTLLALALSGGLSFVLARTVTGPIEALTQRARAMAAGDFAGRIPVRGRDEVGELALVFNHLAGRLQQTLDEIRREQRRAAAILNNMTDGVLALDAAGCVLLCNPAAAFLLQVDAEAITGMQAAAVVPASLTAALHVPGAGSRLLGGEVGSGDERDARDGFDRTPSVVAIPEHAPDFAAMTAAQPAAMGAAWEPSADGAVKARGPRAPGVATAGSAHPAGIPVAVQGRQLLAHIAPLVEAGTPRGMVVVLQDVTARERLEAMRKEFVANVSHDLRTPLTTIRLYAETLLAWGLSEPEQVRPKLEVIADETDRMTRLIDDLLELSHLDAQGGARRRRPVDLAALSRDVAARLAERVTQKGLRITVDAPEAPVPVLADEDRIVRVLTNLLANAIEFTAPGGRVTLCVTPHPHSVTVAVTDTGVGIAPEDIERVFDRFYRVDPSRSREHGGSGLGLAIAREIVEAHGGHIEAESSGQGSTFRFMLPASGLPVGE